MFVGPILTRVLAGAGAMVAAAALGLAGPSQAREARGQIWRLDCGRFDNVDMTLMSDDDRYRGLRRDAANPCYLIRSGSLYMLWETGLVPGSRVAVSGGAMVGPRVSLASQLARVGVKPDQISFIGISHGHPDHIGQSPDFPTATLLIGAADWDYIKAHTGFFGATFAPWLSGGSTVVPLATDRDVFGDGSVVMLKTPGHTAGHYSLLLKNVGRRPLLLSGDLYAMRESFDHDVVPAENVDRADTLASFDRFKRLVKRYHATVVVQHEPADLALVAPVP